METYYEGMKMSDSLRRALFYAQPLPEIKPLVKPTPGLQPTQNDFLLFLGIGILILTVGGAVVCIALNAKGHKIETPPRLQTTAN